MSATAGGVEEHVESADHDCNVAGIDFHVKYFMQKPAFQ